MAAEKKESPLKKIIPLLFSPATIGIYITLILSYGAYEYYATKDILANPNTLIKIISDADDKSIDYRLKFRGIRPASEQVAILAVDDRSLRIIGRWPWPRDTLAIAINNAFENGAKVISSDIVWSESTDRPDVKLINNLSQKNLIPSNISDSINKELEKTDPDKIFSEYIDKYKDKFIIGNFYDDAQSWLTQDPNSGYQTVCHDIIFENSALFKMIEQQQIPIVVSDRYEAPLPREIKDIYIDKMSKIEEDFKAKNPITTGFEGEAQKIELLKEKEVFCKKYFLKQLEPATVGGEYDEAAATMRENWSALVESIPDLKYPSFDEWFVNFSSRNLYNIIPETLDWTLTISPLANRGVHFGYFNAKLDSDGTIRSSQLITRTGSLYMPSIALQAYLLATNQHIDIELQSLSSDGNLKGLKKVSVKNDEDEVQFDIPVDKEGKLIINYAGPGRTIPHASIADLLNTDDPMITVERHKQSPKGDWVKAPPERVDKKSFFKDKILILGATAIGVFDLRVTPFDENFPGVETHANVVDNLLRRDFLSRTTFERFYMPGLMLVLGIITSLALAHFGALSGLIFIVLLSASMFLIDKHFLFQRGYLASIILPLFQVIFTYVFLTFYKYFTEERSKKELRATFSKYVSPAIVEEILQDPKNLELGGRKERVTVFFSDVRGFTTISEKLDPRALSDLLNSYLTPMTDLVFKNQGTLDKYMGDAIMAFFGAPVHYPDHAKMACRCALQNLEKLKELQAVYEKKKLPNIDIGIGLNTGECSVGNMGSETVRSYTVMGDAVNLASRLEGINKTYGTHIIISEFTYEEVKNDFICREVDWVRVKGKLEPVKIYELIAEGKAAPHILEMVKNFSEGYEHYHRKQFDKAIALFNRAVQAHSEDETSKIYIERCQEYIQEPPPADWDGVYVMKTK